MRSWVRSLEAWRFYITIPGLRLGNSKNLEDLKVDDPEDASEKRYVLIDRAWMRFWRIHFWSKNLKVLESRLEQSAQRRES